MGASGCTGRTDYGQSTESISDVLAHVRPDWTPSELKAVVEKFSFIDIDTTPTLFSLLRVGGPESINEKLKEAGKRTIKAETLQALLSYEGSCYPTSAV